MTVNTTLTRQELYDRVWQTPMVKIAAEYGISGRGLAKLCERHAIPVPGRGHWALTRAGYVMERDPLPADPPPETRVSITGDPGPEKEEHPDVAAQLAYEKEHPITVPDHLNRPHRLVAHARDALRPRVPGIAGVFATRGNPLPIKVSSKQIPRALRLLDALFKACEQRGFVVTKVGEGRDTRTRITVHGDGLSIGLEEPNRRADHVLTAREEAERQKGRGWGIPQYDYTPSGIFIFTIDEYTEGLRHRWSDRKSRPLEACLNDIIVSLVRIAVTVLEPRRLEAQRQHQLWLEEARRRQIYQAKMDALNKALQDWQENQHLRAFIRAVEGAAKSRFGEIRDGSPVDKWLLWATELADRNDPLGQFINGLGKEDGG
jgi:hypothetical protein